MKDPTRRWQASLSNATLQGMEKYITENRKVQIKVRNKETAEYQTGYLW